MINELFWLIFGHFLGDYALQSDWVAKTKKHDNYVLLAHSVIWTGTIAVILYYFGMLSAWKVIFLVGGHFIMDYIKCHSKKDIWKIDQFFHVMQLLIIVIL